MGRYIDQCEESAILDEDQVEEFLTQFNAVIEKIVNFQRSNPYQYDECCKALKAILMKESSNELKCPLRKLVNMLDQEIDHDNGNWFSYFAPYLPQILAENTTPLAQTVRAQLRGLGINLPEPSDRFLNGAFLALLLATAGLGLVGFVIEIQDLVLEQDDPKEETLAGSESVPECVQLSASPVFEFQAVNTEPLFQMKA